MARCISVSGTYGPGRPVGHDSQSIGSPFHCCLVVVRSGLSPDLGALSGEDGGWLPSIVDVSMCVSSGGCIVVSTVALDIFEGLADSVAAVLGLGESGDPIPHVERSLTFSWQKRALPTLVRLERRKKQP